MPWPQDANQVNLQITSKATLLYLAVLMGIHYFVVYTYMKYTLLDPSLLHRCHPFIQIWLVVTAYHVILLLLVVFPPYEDAGSKAKFFYVPAFSYCKATELEY